MRVLKPQERHYTHHKSSLELLTNHNKLSIFTGGGWHTPLSINSGHLDVIMGHKGIIVVRDTKGS